VTSTRAFIEIGNPYGVRARNRWANAFAIAIMKMVYYSTLRFLLKDEQQSGAVCFCLFGLEKKKKSLRFAGMVPCFLRMKIEPAQFKP